MSEPTSYEQYERAHKWLIDTDADELEAKTDRVVRDLGILLAEERERGYNDLLDDIRSIADYIRVPAAPVDAPEHIARFSEGLESVVSDHLSRLPPGDSQNHLIVDVWRKFKELEGRLSAVKQLLASQLSASPE